MNNSCGSGTFRAGLIRYNLETKEFVNFQADGQAGQHQQ